MRDKRRNLDGSTRQRRHRQLRLSPLEPRLVLSTTTSVASGEWHDPATWSNGVPDSETQAIVAQGTAVELTGVDHVAKELAVHGTLRADERAVETPAPPTTTAEGRLTLYVDGVAVGAAAASQLWSHSAPIAIGAPAGVHRTHTALQNSRAPGFAGEIDSFAMFNRALSSQEVASLAAVERSGPDLLANNDAAAYYAFTSTSQPGDFDGDGTVGETDNTLWRTTYGALVTPGAGADGNRDGSVGAADYTVWRDHFGQSTGAPVSVADTAPFDVIEDDGVLQGQAAVVGDALILDGVSDRLLVPPSAELTDAVFTQKTVSFWFSASSTAGSQLLFHQGDEDRGLSVYLRDGVLYAGGWNTPTSESGWQGDWVSLGGIAAGEWTHVALTLNADQGELITDKTLTADWVHVNSAGLFEIGSARNRYDEGTFTLVLTGDDPNADPVVPTATGSMQITDNNAFLMTAGGGRLSFYGDERLPFTKLASTAPAGAVHVDVEEIIERNFDGTTSEASDGRLDWRVGDRIVVASSSISYRDEEVRTVTGVTKLGDGVTRLFLDTPLSKRHYGEIETYGNGHRSWDIDLRAEVALLNRSIVVTGDEGSDTDTSFGNRALWDGSSNNGVADGVGGHVMLMPGSGRITLDSVNFDRLGQAGRLGRYPVHWHLGRDRTGDVLRSSSVTNSNNRGVVIHGAQNILVEGNVLHDIHGHGFFQEDGAEFGNEFWSNIALGVHRVGGSPAQAGADPFTVPGITRSGGLVSGTASRGGNGESSHDSGQQVFERFRHSAAYWITNPDNIWVGNVSAGSEGTGFWFALPDEVLALSKDTGLYNGLRPNRTNLGRFDHNTTHSSIVGLTFDRGRDIDPGASNTFQPPQTMRINHLTAYKHNGTAVYHRAIVGVFNESRFADNAVSSFNTFSQEEHNILFVGHSRGNANTGMRVGGYRLYDGPGEIEGAHFAGFARSNAYMFDITGGANKHAMTSARDISFENDGSAANLRIDWRRDADLATNQAPEFVGGRPDSISGLVHDLDGSLTGHLGGQAGHVLTPRLDFYRDATDIAFEGFDGYLSDDRYGQFKVSVASGTIPDLDVTNPAGTRLGVLRPNVDDVQRMYVKVNAGDYRVSFRGGTPSGGFGMFMQVRQGSQPGDATVFQIVGAGASMKPTQGVEVASIDAVRSASANTFHRAPNGDLWWKIFQSGTTRNVRPTTDPPLGAPQSPYEGSAFQLQDGARLEFERFDEGGQGVAYFDSSSATNGNPTRDTLVDGGILPDGGEHVGWNTDGEWLEYTSNITTGVYDLTIRYASGSSSPGDLLLLVGDGPDGANFSQVARFDFALTASWGDFQTLTIPNVAISGGVGEVLRFEIVGGGFNLDYVDFNLS